MAALIKNLNYDLKYLILEDGAYKLIVANIFMIEIKVQYISNLS